MDQIEIKEAIVVEGHYDVMRLREIVSSAVIETGGFAVFKDKSIQNLIIELAKKQGIIILTDSDAAGFKIRAFVAQLVPTGCVKHAYIPEIQGVERRKDAPSSANLLGVEGIDKKLLKQTLLSVTNIGNNPYIHTPFDTGLFYSIGLSGREDSAIKRRKLLAELGLPTRMTTRSMCRLLPYLLTEDMLRDMVRKLS